MTSKNPGESSNAGQASHGAASEVTWDGGAGRQPYSNQGSQEGREPNGGDEVSEGDRGEASGRNLKQLEQVKEKSPPLEDTEQHQQQDDGQGDPEEPKDDGHLNFSRDVTHSR